MNRSLVSSKPSGTWRSFVPTIDGSTSPWAAGGAAAQSSGRYLYDRDSKLVIARYAIQLGASPTQGSGWCLFGLPVPCSPQASAIGIGWVQRGAFGLGPNIGGALIPNPGFQPSKGTDPRSTCLMTLDRWSYSGSVGTVGTSTATVAFPYTLHQTPSRSDIFVVPVTSMGTISYYISAISATGFTITVSNAGTFNFNWRVMLEGINAGGPNWAGTSVAPDIGSIAYDSFYGHAMYEAAA